MKNNEEKGKEDAVEKDIIKETADSQVSNDATIKTKIEPLKLVIIICNKSKSEKVNRFLNEQEYNLHICFSGVGTAPSEIASYLGLSEPSKNIFILACGGNKSLELINKIKESKELDFIDGQGIAFILPISSLPNVETLKLITSLN